MAKQAQAAAIEQQTVAAQEPSVFDTARAKADQLYLSAKDSLSSAWAKLTAFFSNGFNWDMLWHVGAWLLSAVVLKFMLLFIGLSASLLGAFVVMGAVSLSKHFANGAISQIAQMYEESKQAA